MCIFMFYHFYQLTKMYFRKSSIVFAVFSPYICVMCVCVCFSFRLHSVVYPEDI